MDRPLRDEDLAVYRREGFVVLGQILDDDEVAARFDAEPRLRPTDAFAPALADRRSWMVLGEAPGALASVSDPGPG